jgi:hypothetical protein
MSEPGRDEQLVSHDDHLLAVAVEEQPRLRALGLGRAHDVPRARLGDCPG